MCSGIYVFEKLMNIIIDFSIKNYSNVYFRLIKIVKKTKVNEIL
jgi:hypothetical protein